MKIKESEAWLSLRKINTYNVYKKRPKFFWRSVCKQVGKLSGGLDVGHSHRMKQKIFFAGPRNGQWHWH